MANLGESAGKAIDFYVDAHIAVANTEEYTKMLRNIFGTGTEHLLAPIIAGLGKRFGVKVMESTSLREVVDSLRPKETGPSTS